MAIERVYINTYKKGDVVMHFLEFKRRFSLLNEEEKEFISFARENHLNYSALMQK